MKRPRKRMEEGGSGGSGIWEEECVERGEE